MTPQPVETAPKDGTPILVWIGGEMWEGLFALYWQAAYWEADARTWSIFTYEGRVVPVTVTHWLPMPDPPSQGDTP